MILTKSFGYALRSILYLALKSNEKLKVQADEIASQLAVPKYFLSKVMKKVVKNGILTSTKGPYGGFSLNNHTLSTSLLELANITNSFDSVNNCVLRLDKCDTNQPCPLHSRMLSYKKDFYTLFETTTIGDLIKQEE